MSVTGFLVNNEVQKYDYECLENYNTPDFSTSSTYQVGDYVMYQGKLYKCKTAITTGGAWDSTKWSLAILSDDVADLNSTLNSLDNTVGVYDVDTTYNTLDPTYNRTMAVYEIKDVNSTFVYEITNKSTAGNLNIRICSEPSPYSAALLQSVATIIPSDTSGNGTFTINSDVKANAKYILILNATNNLLVPFTASLYTQEGIYGRELLIPRVIEVGSDKEYTTLKAGFEALNEGDTLLVNSGTYDLYTEFGGSSFFDSYDSSSTRGLYLKNNCKYIFSPNASVQFNYTGDNQTVRTRFSPLNALNENGCGTFELIGCRIEAKNCRYCVHDDMSNYNALAKHDYKDCVFILDNSTNSDWKSAQCIGGGFGKNSIINIESCVFDGTVHTSYVSTAFSCTWHQGYTSDIRSILNISNNYFKKGTISIRYYGQTEKVSSCIVSNNSVPDAIDIRAESSSGSPYVNVELLEWNNEIRSAESFIGTDGQPW